MRITRKKIVVGLVIVLIIGAGIVISVIAVNHFKKPSHNASTSLTPIAQTVLATAKDQQDKGQSDKAKTTLVNYLNSNPTNQADRYRAEKQLATVYIDEKNYDLAVTYQNKSVEDAPTAPNFYDYSDQGDDYVLAGNKSAAITAYKNALKAAHDQPSIDTAGQTTFLNSKIADLQAK
jgi:predicted negative regulator of RcsB-dependent stress response